MSRSRMMEIEGQINVAAQYLSPAELFEFVAFNTFDSEEYEFGIKYYMEKVL